MSSEADARVERKGRCTKFESNCAHEGVMLRVDHHGVTAYGCYDGIVATRDIFISLDDMEAALKNARRKR
jgi:hypothetical protein